MNTDFDVEIQDSDCEEMEPTQGFKDKLRHTQDYIEYLQSPAWDSLRRRKLKDANYRCENCKFSVSLQVHHLHYATLFHESLSDLQALCNGCHRYRHGKGRDLKTCDLVWTGPCRDGKYQLSKLKLSTTKYKGIKRCLYCRQGSHHNCRPRNWDDTLCGCDCNRSKLIMAAVEIYQELMKSFGEEVTVMQAWKKVSIQFLHRK